MREKVRHGLTDTPTYKLWMAMRQRCGLTTSRNYHNYGGRGISVCKRWSSLLNFIEDMGMRPSIKHTIDRIDTNGNYSPDNCRWALKKQQSRNRRNNKFLSTPLGVMCVAEAADRFQINRHTLHTRLDRGWSVYDALTTPVNKKGGSYG